VTGAPGEFQGLIQGKCVYVCDVCVSLRQTLP
jgi:hypothetical protein